MGTRGPAPKRSDQRRRANKPEAGEPTKAPGAAEVEIPEADAEWHPVARRWYESLATSGQRAFYEPSDWATAYLLAESMSRELHPQPIVSSEGEVTMVRFPPKAASVAAWLKGTTALLATEADRRRVSLELERPQPPSGEGGGDVAWIDDARRRLREPG